MAYNSINVHRSMLVTTLDFDGEIGIRNNLLVKKLMKAIYDDRPPKAKYSTTWPIQQVLDLFKTWGPNTQLDFRRLARKTVLLVAITTFLRCSELSSIVFSSLVFSPSCVSFSLAKPRKAQRSGPLCRFRIEAFEDPLLCPVACLKQYVQKSSSLRGEHDLLFIGVIPPHKPIGGSSAARWIKTSMKESGIDLAAFAAHSTRGAASSQAFDQGIPIDHILETGGWSGESTFVRFYRRQTHRLSISNAVLSPTL